MKKVLLASTALLLTAGFASAQSSGITLSGDGKAGLVWVDGGDAVNDADEFSVKTELDIEFGYAGTTDAGMDFGGALTFDEGGFDGIELFIAGTWGTLTAGELDPATDNLGLSDVGLFGVGVDDLGDALRNATLDGASILYEYNFSDFTFAASGSTEDDDGYALYVEYDNGMFFGALGYARDSDGAELFVLDDLLGGNVALGDVNSNYTISAQAGVTSGPVSGEILYSDWTVEDGGAEVGIVNADGDFVGGGLFIDGAVAWGLELAYDFGAVAVNAGWTNFSAKDVDGSSNAYGIGFDYPLGGGLAVEGGIGIIDTVNTESVTAADLGLSFQF